MKKLNIETMVLAAVITIPLVIATINARMNDEPNIMPAAAIKTTEAELQTETTINEEVLTEIKKQPDSGKYESTEPQFEAYSFIPLDVDKQCAIYALCEKYEIEFELIMSVIMTESSFDEKAVGDNGNSIGLMQIQPKWWQELADSKELDIYDPVDNVHLGIIILMQAMEDNSGDLEKALKQYNSGNPNYPGDEYVNKVFSNYEWILGELEK